MEAGTTFRFAAVARSLAGAARRAGLVAPAFRSPPRAPGVVRAIRRYPGGAVVSVLTGTRPFDRVAADMVEGVIAANGLEGPAAHRVRLALWEVVAEDLADELTDGEPPAGEADWAVEQARMAERQTQAA